MPVKNSTTTKRETRKQVVTLTHDEASRKNIPTAEYQPVMDREQISPIRVAYERRNRDLDPQLVWRGKDEQDWSDLVVPAPPLYIQEKVHPKVLIDDLLRRGQSSGAPAHDQFDLFADFNGLPSEAARTEFYQHDANWSNRTILGDSLQVMASLAEREGLRGQVQCIYIDPPYGIKFNSNFQWSTTSRDVKDGNPEHITREPEQVKAFRDTWRDGTHSYLTYLRDRLTVARDLLANSGSIFVQIGDENVHRIRALMDEVFGDDNLVAQISFKTTDPLGQVDIAKVYDYIAWYAKDISAFKFRGLFREREIAEDKECVEDAKKTLEERKQKLSAADEAHQKTIEDLKSVREEKAAHEGALKVLRESAAKLDETAARNAVQQVETDLKANHAPEPPVSEERLAEVRQAVEDAHAALKNIDDEIQAKRGALQQVGGDVSKQRAAEAAAQLDTAKQREREAELDFNAWELLRQTLREAEQEESSHLGRLLAGPIESRFSELTSRRYTKLALGPALEMQGVFVAGDDRDVSLLSVGTKDQLSTVLRLTIAEQLKSAIVLDDQLTQSDQSRMQWLHDFLVQMAANIQVIVFTCRPETYFPNGTPHSAARLLDLTGVIERSLGTPTHLSE